MLVVLAATSEWMTGRQIAGLARRGQSASVSAALNRLVAQGIVERQPAGRALLHRLNRSHLAAAAVDTLAGMRRELIDRLRRQFDGWTVRPIHASLFGSAARGDGDERSDIDLLLVRPMGTDEEDPTWRADVADLSAEVLAWTGNHAAVIEQSVNEATAMLKQPPPILANLERDGIVLAGSPLKGLAT